MIIKVKNMKKLFRTGFITALAVILATGWCYGATILFPYINSNPGNLSTIVNVINTATLADLGCSATEDLQLASLPLLHQGGHCLCDRCL
jgi:hypothetical protein